MEDLIAYLQCSIHPSVLSCTFRAAIHFDALAIFCIFSKCPSIKCKPVQRRWWRPRRRWRQKVIGINDGKLKRWSSSVCAVCALKTYSINFVFLSHNREIVCVPLIITSSESFTCDRERASPVIFALLMLSMAQIKKWPVYVAHDTDVQWFKMRWWWNTTRFCRYLASPSILINFLWQLKRFEHRTRNKKITKSGKHNENRLKNWRLATNSFECGIFARIKGQTRINYIFIKKKIVI